MMAAPGGARVAALQAQSSPPASSRALRHGFAVDRLARIDSMLEDAVQREEIGGLVALVLRDDAVVYQKAVGWRDRESRVPMTTNTLFRIASQTKALTSAAVLMLMEEGMPAKLRRERPAASCQELPPRDCSSPP
ncbi:MAG: class A beta-lactamase-related serine hydrolase, partial [Gemmatimonadaceae bacterium]|nr:class A beta-lactamase-related serine hydrolase [Gemmatimonadaceae bacterium]